MEQPTCRVPECPRTDVVGYDKLCRMHYGRKRKLGTTELPVRAAKPKCSVETCDELVRTSDLCGSHYSRLLRTGSARPDVPVRKLRELGDSKACAKCGVVKPLDDFTFDNRRRDGRQAHCRECVSAYQQRYRQEKRDRYLELRRAESQRRKPQTRAYVEANRDRINEMKRKRVAAMDAEARETYNAKHRTKSAEYRAANPELCNERIRKWKKANPDKAAEGNHRRRTWRYGNGTPEKFSRTEIGERDGWICGICDLPVDKTLQWPNRMMQSLDHIVPLSLGGHHTRANSRISHWICNVRRGADRRRDAA